MQKMVVTQLTLDAMRRHKPYYMTDEKFEQWIEENVELLQPCPSRERRAFIMHRKCACCGVVKPLNEDCFTRKITKKSGFKGICKKCERRRNADGGPPS